MRMPLRTSLLIVLLPLLLLGGTTARGGDAQAFAVIAARGFAQQPLTRAAVAQIFLHKTNFWSDGTRIHPINLPANNALRINFSQIILGNSPDQFENYWREMYFHGVLPPHVVESEEAMLLFIRSTPGAIGYISGCIPATGIDIVLTVGNLPHCAK